MRLPAHFRLLPDGRWVRCLWVPGDPPSWFQAPEHDPVPVDVEPRDPVTHPAMEGR